MSSNNNGSIRLNRLFNIAPAYEQHYYRYNR